MVIPVYSGFVTVVEALARIKQFLEVDIAPDNIQNRIIAKCAYSNI